VNNNGNVKLKKVWISIKFKRYELNNFL
jgi:hypothetical protein